MSQSLADQLATTALSGGNAGFIEDLYEQFLRDPSSLDPAWVSYFKGLPGSGAEPDDAFGPKGLTDVEGLKGILSTMQLWATNAVFLNDRTEHLARTAPRGPKIHQHRLGTLQDLAVEVGLGNLG